MGHTGYKRQTAHLTGSLYSILSTVRGEKPPGFEKDFLLNVFTKE